MVVNNLYFVRVSASPDEANAPLVVDADAVLSLAVAVERLKAIARWGSQVTQRNSGIQLAELPERHRLDGAKARDPFSLVEALRVLRPEALDHLPSV